MPNLRCPKCSSIVNVAPGAQPACPACGFGRPAAAPAAARPVAPRPATAPASLTATPRPTGQPPAARARKSRAGVIVACVLAGVLVLGGAAAALWLTGALDGSGGGKSGPLSQAEAARVGARASEQLDAAMASPDGGGLSAAHIDGEMEGDGEMPAGDVNLTMEWGSNGVVHLRIRAAFGAFTIDLEKYCSDAKQVVVYGDEAYEGRPYVAGGDCFDGEVVGQDDLGIAEDDMVATYTPTPDGGVTVTYRNATATATLHVDGEGRAVAMALDDEDGAMEGRFEYGRRAAIAMPSAEERMPAEIEYEEDWDFFTGAYTFTVVHANQTLPLAEFTVRIYDDETYYSQEDPAPLVTIPMERSTSSGGFRYDYLDANQDGKVSAGDSFTVTGPPDIGAGFTVEVYDEWARRSIDDQPIPGPGMGLLALALAALAGLAARRRA